MKKVLPIILIMAVSCLSGCDFFRKVAGRPTSGELQEKKNKIEARARYVRDSIKVVQETVRIREQERQDSIASAAALADMGVLLSDVFRFGTPLEKIERKYNVIIGVYRQFPTASAQVRAVKAKGFEPFYIPFHGDVNAVALGSSDCLSEVLAIVREGRRNGACPKDAWVYVRE